MSTQNMTQVGPSSFGAANTTTGPENSFRARTFLDSQRFRELDRKQSYYDCTQHDYKRFDFDGRVITSTGGMSATQPLLSSEKAAWYVPLRARRPSAPYRLGRVIVNAFTNLLFGEGRFPTFRVEGDSDTQDFIQAIVRGMNLPVKMIQARNLGGAIGTVGMSWCYLNGKPRCEVHNAKHLHVHEWEDREQCIPRHVTELYQYQGMPEWDGTRKRYVTNTYWYRRDWTPNVDIVFNKVKVEPGKDPIWTPDLDRSEEHNDGLIHFSWIQNRPSHNVDGYSDCEGLYEGFDTIDLLLSVVTRGATLNLDPTLKLKMDPDIVNRMGVRKGSDNALVTGKDGDAEYLELEGRSIESGIKLCEAKRKWLLEVAQCVLPNPEEIAGNGTSSVAMKMLYAPMLGVSDIHREQYAAGMIRIIEPMTVIARAAMKSTVTIYDQDKNPQEVKRSINLPQRIERTPKTDDEGKPTGEDDIEKKDRTPGEGGEIEPQWGPYFAPTPTDQASLITALSTAVAAAAIMSTQTATELVMGAFGRNPADEVARVAKEAQAQKDAQAEMFPPTGGAPGQDGMPPGAKPKGPPKPPGAGGPPKPPGFPPKPKMNPADTQSGGADGKE